MSEKTFIGYKPFAHQKAVHDFISQIGPEAGYIVCCKAKRQVGKSAMIEQELLRAAINHPNSVSILVTLTYPNCKKIYDEMLSGIKGTGVLSKENGTDMEFHFINGSRILFKSCVIKDRLRGYTCKNGGILVVDEAAFIPDEIFGIISPWCDVYKANMILVSTPKLKSGFFYEFFNEGLKGTPNIKSFDFNDFDTSFLLSPEKLETYRKLLPKNQFVSDYLGLFVDDYGSVFDLSKNIFIKDEQPVQDIYIGIDWSAGKNGDYTCISAFDRYGVQVGLDYTNDLSPTDQINWISNIIRVKYANYHILNVICEQNSIGAVYFDMLKGRLPGYSIEEFVTSNTSKREIIEYMIKRINEETVKFQNDPEMYSELGSYQMEITSSGAITYNAITGKHDDFIMASAFALKCLKDLESSSYTLSFGHKTGGNQKNLLRKKWK